MKNFWKLFLSIIICESAGLIGTIFTFSSINSWYSVLNKPFFTPPNWLFGPVWTTLYLLMGISLYLILQAKTKNKKIKSRALQIFFLQLGLNAIWSIVFFGLHAIFLSLIVIILLWFLIFETIRRFAKIKKQVSFLLYPYIVWVSLAVCLNFGIFLLNR